LATQAAHLPENGRTPNPRFRPQPLIAVLLLAMMAWLAWGAALKESVTFDELAHVGAGLSYWQTFDLRLNEEHPPLAKLLAGLPLALTHTYADYTHVTWNISRSFFPAYMGQWIFGEYVLTRWNPPARVLAWARFPMLLLTLALGWLIYVYGSRIGGPWGGILPLIAYVTAPVFLVFGPLVLTDLAITLFSLWTLWRFAELWQNPTRRNTLLFALALAGALLSKFSAGILFFAFLGFSLSTRWRAVPGQPDGKQEARLWRRARWRRTFVGVLWAAAVVYVVYFIFSWNQTSDVLYMLGRSPAFSPLHRLLMPPWLYLRGILMVVFTGNRPAYLLGHIHPHGVWYYFPVLLVLKSPLGFLALLVVTGLLALRWRQVESAPAPLIAPEVQIHWRVLWVSLIVYSVLCILSHLNVSFRHFSIPLVLMMLLLAPLPAMLQRFLFSARPIAVAATALCAVSVLGMLFVAVSHYPYYMPYVNSLSFGRPAYTLMSDSNVDWNQSLPAVAQFAQQRGIQKIKIDEYAFTESSAVVPGSELWDCQYPAAEDAGHWVVVSANMIVDSHNCTWLMRYPNQPLGGGAMYAVQLPAMIPAAGTPGGPPAANEAHMMLGIFPREPRMMFQELMRDPDRMSDMMKEMQRYWQEQQAKAKQKK
jgi:dolichyl-phosphate-mannose-protein mannosyltransferase